MRELRITPDSKEEEIASFAVALHNIIRLPLAMRSLNEKGVIYRHNTGTGSQRK